MSSFDYTPDPEHEAAELHFGNYVLVVQPGEYAAGHAGHHLALYPAFVVRDLDPNDDYPAPLLDILLTGNAHDAADTRGAAGQETQGPVTPRGRRRPK